MCADYGATFLGSLPLAMSIREQTDSGRPSVVAEPDGPIARTYKEIARKTAIKIAEKAGLSSAKFPTISIQNT